MRPTSLVIATLLLAGCGKQEPLVPVDQFPKALIGLEAGVEKVFAAFDAGDPKGADETLHRVPALLSTIDRLAEPAGLDADQQAALKQATEKLMDAFGDLHAPMHKEVFPEDFEFEPIRERLIDGLKAMRAALPASFVAEMQAAKEKRAADRESEETKAAPDEKPQEEAADASPELPAPEEGAAMAAPSFRVAANRQADAIAPLCPSVMLWDDASYELAPERVNRASDLMAGAPPDRRWVQLVPTLHARLNEDLTIDAYGAMRDRSESWTDPANFEPATGALADRFRDAFAAAIRQAVRRGIHVAILPHLDPAGGPTTEWRNLYDFAPGEAIGAGSYESLLIEPLAAAIEAEATSDTRIDLALSGEMGRSLFEHPAEYLGLLERLSKRFAANPRAAGVGIGVALNWSGLEGGIETGQIDREAVAELFASCDFVSFSCYAPVGTPPTADDFRLATKRFYEQLSSLGASLNPSAPLIYAETGIGGGEPSASIKEVAAKPYLGKGNPKVDPWRDAGLADLRHQYHAALLDYLATAGEVEKAFLWSEGPWDPQGVADRRFRDEEIAKLIAEHNKR